MITTIKFPNATVKSHAADMTDFMDCGASEYAKDKPLIENIISPAVITKI
jgi:hypothetical protein